MTDRPKSPPLEDRARRHWVRIHTPDGAVILDHAWFNHDIQGLWTQKQIEDYLVRCVKAHHPGLEIVEIEFIHE